MTYRVLSARPHWLQEKSTDEERAVADFIQANLNGGHASADAMARAQTAIIVWWRERLSTQGLSILSSADLSILRRHAWELLIDVIRDPEGWWEFAVLPAGGDALVWQFCDRLKMKWLDAPKPSAPKVLEPIDDVDPF